MSVELHDSILIADYFIREILKQVHKYNFAVEIGHDFSKILKIKYDCGTFIGTYDENVNRKKGKFYFENGDFYNGMWENEKFNGYGKYSRLETKSFRTYTGYWKDDYRNGIGQFEYDEQKIVCHWNMDFKNGAGIIFAANGDIFTSSLLFKDDLYESSHKVILNEDSTLLIKEVLKMVLEDNVGNKIEEFYNLIDTLIKGHAETNISEQYPLNVPYLQIDLGREKIVDFVSKVYPEIQESEKLKVLEIESLQQVISSNSKMIFSVYNQYAKLRFGVIRSNCMKRLHLWQFYQDIGMALPESSIQDKVLEAEATFNIIVYDQNDPEELVKKSDFLKYLLHITMILNKDEYVIKMVLQDHPRYFGLFATMFLIYLRDFIKVNQPFCEGNLIQILNLNKTMISTLYQYSKNQNSKFTTKTILEDSAFTFQNGSCKVLEYVSEKDYLNCIKKVIPYLKQVETEVNLSFLEYFTIFYHLMEEDLKMKKAEMDEIEKQKEKEAKKAKPKGSKTELKKGKNRKSIAIIK